MPIKKPTSLKKPAKPKQPKKYHTITVHCACDRDLKAAMQVLKKENESLLINLDKQRMKLESSVYQSSHAAVKEYEHTVNQLRFRLNTIENQFPFMNAFKDFLEKKGLIKTSYPTED